MSSCLKGTSHNCRRLKPGHPSHDVAVRNQKKKYLYLFKQYFQVPYGDVMTKTLVFAVYDYDRFSKHDAIGEVRLPVCQMDLAQAREIWKDLQSIVGDGKVSRLFEFNLIYHFCLLITALPFKIFKGLSKWFYPKFILIL